MGVKVVMLYVQSRLMAEVLDIEQPLQVTQVPENNITVDHVLHFPYQDAEL